VPGIKHAIKMIMDNFNNVMRFKIFQADLSPGLRYLVDLQADSDFRRNNVLYFTGFRAFNTETAIRMFLQNAGAMLRGVATLETTIYMN
jgi:hypothetical protein